MVGSASSYLQLHSTAANCHPEVLRRIWLFRVKSQILRCAQDDNGWRRCLTPYHTILNFFLNTHSVNIAISTPPHTSGAFQISWRSSRLRSALGTLKPGPTRSTAARGTTAPPLTWALAC